MEKAMKNNDVEVSINGGTPLSLDGLFPWEN